MKTVWLHFALLFAVSGFAQSPSPFNSGKTIEEAIQLHDDGAYKKAIALYQKVPRNDTNYARAQYEIALSYMQDSNYVMAIKVCDETLKLDDRLHELDLFIVKGSSLDYMNNPSEALQLYDSALLKYPNAQNLLLNKAITLLHIDKTEEAEKILKVLVVRNPYYSSAHIRLANCALKKGRIIPAMMSLFCYLVINPEGNQFQGAIKLLDNISKSTDAITEIVEKRSEPEETFSQVEQVILSRIALDKQYKLQSSLDDPIVRQLQALMELVKYNESDTDFWMQYYVPLFKKLFAAKMLEPAVHHAFSNINMEPIQRYVKKNDKNIKSFISELVIYLNQIRATQIVDFTKRTTAPATYHFGNNLLVAKGQLNAKGGNIGFWEFYHPNGNIKSAGNFKEDKKDGEWKFYFQDGTLNGTEKWADGMRKGEDLTYTERGTLLYRSHYNNDKLNGKKQTYYAIGTIKTEYTYKDDKLEGPYKAFFPSGHKSDEAQYSNDKLQGPYKSYYNNEQLGTETNYLEGVLDGPYKTYYKSGQLSFEGVYKKGKLDGLTKYYHPNGKIKESKTFNNDKLVGPVKEFNSEGILLSEINYENDLAQGLAKYYDDGKLFSTFLFDKGNLKEAKYLDKAGKEISSSIRKNKSIELNVFNSEGFKVSNTIYNEAGNAIGKKTYYYNSGKVKETNLFTEGAMEGVATGYFENGLKEFEVAYSKNEKNGLATYFYSNGQIKLKGWYSADAIDNDWEHYNEKGNITSRYSYLHGDLTGYYEINLENGRKDYEEVYHLGWLTALHSYDTLGKKIFSCHFKNGNGKYTTIFQNGKKRFEGTLLNGELHGAFTSFYFDGTVRTTKTYVHGALDGVYTDYHFNGKIASQGVYKDDQQSGTWKYSSYDGTVWKEEIYNYGKLNGKVIYYHSNGKLEREIAYKDGLRNGVMKRYNEEGQLMGAFYYKDDLVTGYSYNNKEGQLLPVIQLPGGAGKVQAFYSNGFKSIETEYSDGKIHGVFSLFHTNGKLMYQTTDSYNITNGKLVEYYENGNLKSEYNYLLDNQDGSFKEYFENGKIKEEGQFYNGVLNGYYHVYESTGKLASKKYFYYGTLLNSTQ